MLIGYCRTSTVGQQAGFEAQLRDLQAAGCERIFSEQVSSIAHRDKLTDAIAFVREGDVFVVTKLDRLARSMFDLADIVRKLEAKGVALKIISMDLDTRTSNGKLMLNIFGAVAQFEREIMLERQREGIAKAKGLGKYKGRTPTARAKSAEIITLAKQGVSKEKIAKTVGVGVASVYRVLALGDRATVLAADEQFKRDRLNAYVEQPPQSNRRMVEMPPLIDKQAQELETQAIIRALPIH